MNMEDQKLLELAAKACGAKWSDYSDGSTDHWMMQAKSGSWINWNPLINDGDALRLAVKLDLTIYRPGSDPAARRWTDSGIVFHEADCVRRAIVCAAAEIGKAMQEHH